MEAIVQYRPEIDGLRTIAVVPVVLFHAGLHAMSGGFVGVDIFFVISGYLITSILMRDLQAGRFSILQFYERRARRILPALVLMTVISIPFALWLLPPRDLDQYFESVVGIATFSSNFVFNAQADYFDGDAAFKPMLHTWSLAVEEQYYILFPPILALAWRWKPKAVLPLMIAGLAASIVAAELVVRKHPSAAFYMLPTRAWELALGGIVALFAIEGRWQPGAKTAQLGSLAGLMMILLSLFVINEDDAFPGVAALLPTVGSALVIHCARRGTLVCRLLSIRPVVAIGLISYSAYLWHQPLFAFARHFHALETPAWVFVLLTIATFVLAWLSWRFIESPFRDRQRIGRKPIFLLSGVSLASLATIGLAGLNMADNFASPALARAPQLLSYRYDNRTLRKDSWSILRRRTGDANYIVAGNPADDELWFDTSDHRSSVLILGDSHAKDLFNTLFGSRRFERDFQIARYGCEIADCSKTALNSANYRAADIVVLSSRYNNADIRNLARLSERILADGKRLVIVKRIFDFPQFRHKTLNEADVVAITAIEAGEQDGPAIARRINRAYFESYLTTEQSAEWLRANTMIDHIATRFRDVTVVDRMDLVCDRTRKVCYASDDDLQKSFYDYGHQTLAGSALFGRRIDETGWLISELNSPDQK